MPPTAHTTNSPGRKNSDRVYGVLCTLEGIVPTAPLAVVSP